MNRRHFQFTIIVSLVSMVGCQQNNTSEDAQQIRHTVAGISDSLNDSDKLATLFAPDAVPDKKWIKSARASEFVVTSVEIDDDMASVGISREDAYGDVVSEHTWKLHRTGSGWTIESCPIEP